MDNDWENSFRQAFRGSFSGVLRWHQLDELWEVIRNQQKLDSWYVYAIGAPPPDEVVSADDLDRFLSEVDSLLRKEHEEDYCGVVYTDSFKRAIFCENIRSE